MPQRYLLNPRPKRIPSHNSFTGSEIRMGQRDKTLQSGWRRFLTILAGPRHYDKPRTIFPSLHGSPFPDRKEDLREENIVPACPATSNVRSVASLLRLQTFGHGRSWRNELGDWMDSQPAIHEKRAEDLTKRNDGWMGIGIVVFSGVCISR